MSWQPNVRKTHRRYCGHATCSDRKWCDCPSATVLASGPLHRWKILVRRTKVSQTTFKENTSVCENFIFSIPEGAWFWGELSNRLSPSSLHPANHTCSWFLGRDTKQSETSRIPICSKHFQHMADKLSDCINFKEYNEMSYNFLPTKWTAAWKTRSRGVRLFISKSKSRRSWSSSHISPSQCITCKVINNPNTSKPEWVTWAQQETTTKVWLKTYSSPGA